MLILSAIVASVFVLDQLTKWLAIRYLTEESSFPVISHIFQLSLVKNTGIAFGLLQGHSELLTLAVTASVLVLLGCSPLFRNRPVSRRMAYGFILGGAVGNWVDRIRHDYVIDFLDFRVWPVFNVADCFITIGVTLFIWFAIRDR